jgi:hypothetical protein
VSQRVSRYLGAAVIAAAAVTGPLLAAVLTPAPTTSNAQCPPGETGVIYGCSPFCLPGKFLDTSTGLCMPVPPPPPPAPRY